MSTNAASAGEPREVLAALRDFRVDRSSPIPLYFQVSRFMEHAIESGDIPNGSLFGNEIVLAEQLGLSRPTMRRAMQDLVDKGLIVRRRGIGTRVVQPKVRRPLELSSLFDDLAGSGQRPTTTVLEMAVVPAVGDVAEQLELPVEADVLKIIRLRHALGNPIARLTNYLPLRLGTFDETDLQERGLYQLMRARGVHLHSASQTVGARSATAAEAKILDERRNAALLTMQRTTYDDQGRAVEYGDHVYAASRYSFEISLLAP